MIDWIKSISEGINQLAILSGALAVIGGLMFRNYLKIKQILYQVTHNGGESMKDDVSKVVALTKEIVANQRINTTRTQLIWEHQGGIGYYECDPDDGKCTFANKFLCDLFDIPLEQFLGWGWLEAIENQSERARIHRSWLAAVKDDIPYNEEYKIWSDGKLIPVKTRAWACKDKNGKVLKMFGTLEEVKLQ